MFRLLACSPVLFLVTPHTQLTSGLPLPTFEEHVSASMDIIDAASLLKVVIPAAISTDAQVARQNYNDMFAAWSPDGQWIAFTSDRSGDPEIYVAKVDGTALRQLTNTPGRDAHPSWSPDGRTILFQSPRDGGHVRIFRMDADGSDQRSIAATNGFCGVPTWSPDARKIAFQCSASVEKFGAPAAPWRIVLLEATEDTKPRAVTFGPGNDQVPGWSPDAQRLLFFSDRSGSNQLYELELSSGEIMQLTSGPATHSSASYSPNGERIALMRAEGDAKADVYVWKPPHEWVRITTSGPEFGIPVFSPDGRQLLIQMPTKWGWRLYLASSDGSGEPREIMFR